jgi:hypothetical protein
VRITGVHIDSLVIAMWTLCGEAMAIKPGSGPATYCHAS